MVFKKKSDAELTQEDIDDLCVDDDEGVQNDGDLPTAKAPFEPAKGVEDYMKEILREVTDRPEGEDPNEIKHIDMVLKLAAGERIISKPVPINKFITVQFASLTGRQRQFISGFITDPVNKDEKGDPIINQALNRQMSMAMMWYSLNGEVLPDLLDRNVYDDIKKMSYEIDARYNVIAGWPAEWMSKFEEAVIAFNNNILEAVSEANVKAF